MATTNKSHLWRQVLAWGRCIAARTFGVVRGVITAHKREWVRGLLRLFFASVLGIALAFWLPKLIGEEGITRKVAKIAAPFIGSTYGPGDARDQIRVLLIDDLDVNQYAGTWPAPYAYFATILDGLASYKPKAVFIDVIFNSQRGDASFAELEQVLCRMHDNKIDVYVAAMRNDNDTLSIRPGSKQAGWEKCVKKVAVEFRDDDLDHMAWSYPMKNDDEGNEIPPSAALAIYEQTFGNKIPDPAFPLALTWGLQPASAGLLWSVPAQGAETKLTPSTKGAAIAEEPAAGPTRAVAAQTTYELYCDDSVSRFRLLLHSLRHALSPERKPVCVYHQALYVREFRTLSDDKLDAALNGKVVMLGTALKYSNDFLTSPLHDRIPGVFLHAMALDNLLTEGSNYPRDVELNFTSEPAHAHVRWVALSTLFIIFLVRIFKDYCLERRHAAKSDVSEAKPCESGVAKRNWIKRKAREAAKATRRKAAEVVTSLILVAVVLYLGQHIFHVAYLTAVHVCIFALIPEWLGWTEDLVNWITDRERSSKA